MQPIPPIVKRAMLDTVTDIGQLTAQELNQLTQAVRKGYIAKGRGGPYPALKTVYALPGFDFAENRRQWIEFMMSLPNPPPRKAPPWNTEF